MDNFDLKQYLAEGRLLKEEKGIDYLEDLFQVYLEGGDDFDKEVGETKTVEFENDGSLIPEEEFEVALQSLPTTVKVDVYNVNFKRVGDNIVGTFKITEGRLYENTGDIQLDGSIMMGGDWETGLEDNEIEFVNQNILHQPTISAKDFLDAHGQLWTMMKEPGGDSDVIESGLIDHVQMGILSVDDAVQVMAMYWEDIDEDDLENYRSTFERAKG